MFFLAIATYASIRDIQNNSFEIEPAFVIRLALFRSLCETEKIVWLIISASEIQNRGQSSPVSARGGRGVRWSGYPVDQV